MTVGDVRSLITPCNCRELVVAAVFDPDDVLRASSGDIGPSGFTRPGMGVVLGAGGDPALRLMVDEHERLHVELNGASAFGILMALVGRGALDLPDEDSAKLLAGLVRLSRTTHEVYATTLSVGALPAAQRFAAMEQYQQYKRYLAIGRALTCGYDQRTLVGGALVVGACIACMQVPLNTAITHDRDWYRKPLAVRAEHSPDYRLDKVQRMLRSGELNFGWIKDVVDRRWLTEDTRDPDGSPEYKAAYHDLLIRIYHQYGWVLTRHDMPVIRWDSHLLYGRNGLDGEDQIGWFASPTIAGDELAALSTATAAESRKAAPIASSEFQSLQRATYGQPVIVMSLDGLDTRQPGRDALNLFDHPSPYSGFHLIARPVEAVLAAYQASDEQAEGLRVAATDGVLTALRIARQTEDGAVVTLLGVMTSSETLDRLIDACLRDPGLTPSFVSTITLTSLMSAGWREEWLTGIRHVAHPVMVSDSSIRLFAALEADPDGFSYQRITVGGRRHYSDPIDVLAIERSRAEHTVERYNLVFGGGVLISNLEMRLGELPGASASDKVLRSPAGHAIAHLELAEPEFGLSIQTLGFTPSLPSEPTVSPEQWERWLSLQRRLHDHQTAVRSRPSAAG